ncbi:MAG: esterase family protein [Clostridia bacterium]|nr:esterase family protein [Clostridia bacterium]
MAFCELHIYSKYLGMQTTVNVILPQSDTDGEIGVKSNSTNKAYKCLYLLHGLSDDQTIWHRRTSIERYATEYGICVVMPCGGRSFYTDMKYGEKYYSYIAHELPNILRGYFNISDRREDNFIAGNSMGGYGALKIGLRECEHFGAAAGLSSVADIRRWLEGTNKTYSPIFGDPVEVSPVDDLFLLAEQVSRGSIKPRLYMGVGTEDFLYEDNLRLKAHLEALELDFTYRESAGEHCWAFWDEYIRYVLKWMLG